GPDDIPATDGFLEIFAGCRAKIMGLAIGDRDLGRIALIVLIGRADQGKIVFIRNGEYDAPVIILEKIGARIGEFLAHHDMAALDKPDIVKLAVSLDTLQNLVGPWSGSIDQQTGANVLALMRASIFQRDRPAFAITAGCHDLGPG